MNIVDYRYENLKNVIFPFPVNNEIMDLSKTTININNVDIEVYDKQLYQYMWYCLKRQNDLNSVSTKNSTVSNDNETFLAFNGHFNLIGKFTRDEYSGIDFKNFYSKIKRNSDKAYWGDYNGDTVVIGNKNKIDVEYFPHPTAGNTTKVLIQPPDKEYDESLIVYVNDEHRKTTLMKNLEVIYVFEQEKTIKLHEIIADSWIY
jgi:hypothetical protein